VGVFQFSPEPGTPAGAMGEQVSDEVKQERWARAMAHQQSIALAKQEAMVGKVVEVLVDGYDDQNGLSLCRSYREAPDVDGYVLVAQQYAPGDRLKVRITGATAYDLEARALRRFDPLPRHHLTDADIQSALAPTISIGTIGIQ
jgi:ribosomal protein S12 methylthiotransferase